MTNCIVENLVPRQPAAEELIEFIVDDLVSYFISLLKIPLKKEEQKMWKHTWGLPGGVKKSAQNKRRYITYLLVRLPFPHLGKHFLYLEHQNRLKLPVACKNINDVFSARPIIYPLYSIHRTRSCAHVLEEPISFLDFLANKASFEVRKQQQC